LIEFANYHLNVNKNQMQFPQRTILVLARKDADGSCFRGFKDYSPPTSVSPAAFTSFINNQFPNGQYDIYENRYLNIFIFENIPGALGFSSFPNAQWPHQGIGIRAELINSFSGGKILAHEFGHFCNLFHTHSDFVTDSCNPDNCGGDFIQTTPLRPYLFNISTEGCTPVAGCNDPAGQFDKRNIMTVFCPEYFEQEQIDRLSFMLNEHHSNLFSLTNLNLTLDLNQNSLIGDVTFSNTNLNNQNFVVQENTRIYISGVVNMNNCQFSMNWDAEVILLPGAILTLNQTNFNSECTRGIWKGVYLNSNAVINANNNCTFAGASTAIRADYGSRVTVQNSSFRDNNISVRLGNKTSSGYIFNYFINNRFEGRFYQNGNRGPDPAVYPRPQIGIEAYQCGGLFVYQDNIFDGLVTAVISENNLSYLVDNTVTDCYNGMLIHNLPTPSRIAVLAQNEVNTRDVGCRVNYAQIVFEKNEIYSNLAVDMLAPKPFPQNESSAFNQNVICGGSQKSIQMRLATDLQINRNECFSGAENYLSMSVNLNLTDNQWWGNDLRMSNVHKSTLRTNATANFSLSGSTKNLLFENLFFGNSNISSSSANTYLCNYFDETEIRNNCIGSDFTGNHFYQKFNLANQNTLISQQINKGNKFINLTANYLANINNLEENRFIVKNAPPYYPDVINGPNTWFLPTGTSTQPGCEQTFQIPVWISENNAKCLDSLFGGTKFVHFSPRQKWILLFNLYRIYNRNIKNIPKAVSPCLAKIIGQYKKKDIGKLEEMEDKKNSLKSLRLEGPVSSTIQSVATQIMSLMLKGSNHELILPLLEKMHKVLPDQEREHDQQRKAHKLMVQKLIDEALAVEAIAESMPASYLAALIPAELALYDADTTYFTPAVLSFLTEVALTCPEDAGEARYIAADIYEAITGVNLLHYSGNCYSPAPEIRSRIQKSDMKIYPNPASEILNISLPASGTVRVYHISGTPAGVYRLKSGEHSIDISGLQSGVYIIEFMSEVGVQQIHKFIRI
jgi:hypothetical protein